MNDTPSIPLEKTNLKRPGKVLVYFLLAVLVVCGCWTGFGYAKLHLALAHAHREFSGRQFMRAEFWTNRALSVDEKNIEATRLMAEINEAQDNPAALGWRIKLAQREPGNTGNIMAWAKCALRYEQDEMALKLLAGLPSDFKNKSAEYHELMAGCALLRHETSVAETHYIRASEIDPGNPLHRVNLAAFRLMNSSNPQVWAASAQDLEGELTNPLTSLIAVRALLYDAIRSGDRVKARRFAEKLHSLPEHIFSDDLNCLEAVISEPAFSSALEAIEHRAESNVHWITETGDWLNAHGMAAETLKWFARFPDALQSNVLMQMAAAQGYLDTGDWSSLEAFVEKCHWDKGEFLRRAMLIRCKRELSQPWEKEWNQLVTEVNANPPNGFLLAQLVIGWKWRNETLDLLWSAASKPQTEAKALQSLWNLYSQTSETSELLRVARAQMNFDPSNPTRENNVAFLSLLLNGASEHSERLAREASITNPIVPEWAATYAYALHLSGKESEAKKVMENLSSEALGRPDIALYYAIVLAANGDSAEARETLKKLNPNGMLPEELKLATDLARQLNLTDR